MDQPLVVSAVAISAAYLLGTTPTAHLVAARHGIDPTQVGSGNPGATNVMRSVGKAAGALTLVGDVLKGIIAAGLGWALGGRGLAILCGVAAVAGHIAPVTRRFRGGRGVATGAGMTMVIFPIATLGAVIWFYLVRAAMGRPSLLSQAGIVVLPVVAVASGVTLAELMALIAAAGLVLAKLWSGRQPAAGLPADAET